MNVKLAEALLRRKELASKVAQLHEINKKDLYEMKIHRQSVTDNVDHIQAQVPKLTAKEVTREYDFYARQLRRVDAAIQQANWTTEIEIDDQTMQDFAE